jgi:hypothetical protein
LENSAYLNNKGEKISAGILKPTNIAERRFLLTIIPLTTLKLLWEKE